MSDYTNVLRGWALVVVGSLALNSVRRAYIYIMCNHNIDESLEGKVVIITGATSGIGKETATELFVNGATVVILSRTLERGRTIADRIRLAYNRSKGQITAYECDTSSLTSVRECAAKLRIDYPEIHILINNAAQGGEKNKLLTNDNLEKTMATNYFGHFLLTILLLPALRRTYGRVVNVSSVMHANCSYLSPESMNFELSSDRFSSLRAYCRSKLAQILFTRHMASIEPQVTHLAVSPGTIAMPIIRHFVPNCFSPLLSYINPAARMVGRIFYKTATEGAQTSIYAALAPKAVPHSGKYLADCRVAKLSSRLALDEQLAEAIFRKSKELVGIEEYP